MDVPVTTVCYLYSGGLQNAISLIFGDGPQILRICFLSTFFTSFIFVMYCLSTLAAKAFSIFKTRIMIVLERLESSDRLFTALGGFLAALVGLLKSLTEIYKQLSA